MNIGDTMNFHTLTIDETLKILNTSIKGLSNDEVIKRKRKYGLNTFNLNNNFFKLFLIQIFNPIIFLLILTLIITIINKSYSDAIFICTVIIINILFNIILNFKCEYPINFKKLKRKKVLVIRNGRKTRISPKKITIGDIIIIEKNNYIKADLKIIVENDIEISSPLNTPYNINNTVLHAGDYILNGSGMGVVFEIGKKTENYKLAKKTSQKRKQKLPFKIKLEKMNRKVCLLTSITTILLFIVLYLKKTEFNYMTNYLVQIIIVSLPIFYTFVLVLIFYHFKRLFFKNVTINTCNVINSLGDTTTIICNKDDILSLNEISAKKVELYDGSIYNVSGIGYNDIGEVIPINPSAKYKDSLYNLNLLGKLVYLNNKATLCYKDNEWKYSGNSFDLALLSLNQKINHSTFENEIIYEINNENYRAYFYKENNVTKISIIGKVENIIDFCDNDQKQILEQYDKWKTHGYKVVGVAESTIYKSKKRKKYCEKDIKNLNFIGLICLINPLKETSKDTIKSCEKEGIRVILTTNEDENNTEKIGKDLNIITKRNELANENDVIHNFNLGERIFNEFVKQTKIFSNISNESLIKIIDSLKRNKETICCLGHSVNDIKFLKVSNISITNNTSIIKSASDLTINNNNFETIINCIKHGKNIYNIINNIMQYLLYCKIIEVSLIFLLIIFKPNTILSISQIMWFDLNACILSLGLIFKDNSNHTKKIISSKKERFKWILATILSTILLITFVLLNDKFNLIQSNISCYITLLVVFIQSILLLYYQNENYYIFEFNLKENWKLYLLITVCLLINIIMFKFLIHIKIIDILLILCYTLTPVTIFEIIKLLSNKIKSNYF